MKGWSRMSQSRQEVNKYARQLHLQLTASKQAWSELLATYDQIESAWQRQQINLEVRQILLFKVDMIQTDLTFAQYQTGTELDKIYVFADQAALIRNEVLEMVAAVKNAAALHVIK